MGSHDTWVRVVDSIYDSDTYDGRVSRNAEPPYDIRTILSDTLKQSVKIFGRDDRSLWPNPDPLLLLEPGCTVGDRDCDQNAICGDKKTLFESWETLWNCLTLAGLALASQNFPAYFNTSMADQLPKPPWADDDLSDPMSKYLYNYTEVTDALRPLGFNLSSIGDFNALKVFNLTFECAQKSCEEWKGQGHCSLNYPQGSDFRLVDGGQGLANNSLQASTMVRSLSAVCDDLPTLNLDIAGPGVSPLCPTNVRVCHNHYRFSCPTRYKLCLRFLSGVFFVLF